MNGRQDRKRGEEMRIRRDTVRKRLRAGFVLVALVSAYAAGLFLCLVFPDRTGGPGLRHAAEAFFAVRESRAVFAVLLCLNSAAAMGIWSRSWREGKRDDRLGRNFRHAGDREPYGQAHLMEPWEYADVAQIRRLADCRGIVVGQLTENGEECVDFNASRINSHMYVTAASGSGKTYGFVKPYIFQTRRRRHSLVMTDPKGELYRDTAGFLMDNGYRVRRLDLKNLELSDGWDCLKRLRGKNMRTRVQIFSGAVLSNISPNDTSIFVRGADSLLQALILRVLLGHDYPESEKNIRSVYQLLQNPAGYDFLDRMFDKKALTEDEMECLPPYMAYKQGSENLSSNIATHLANGLQLFQDGLLCDVLSTDDIDLALPGKEPCAYYCVFPDDHDTYRFIISMFFTMFFMELVDLADGRPDLRLPVPVDFLLDEFPSIGILPDWARKMSTVRSRGISCVMITQDFTQLRQNYRESWPTILNNCGALVTLGINEMETAEWISRRIGDTSIEVASSAQSEIAGRRRKSLVTRQSVGVGRRSLFTPAEIFEIGKDANLVVIAGRDPIYSNKTPYTIFPEAALLRTIRTDEIPPRGDRERKKEMRACENDYVREYWSRHEKSPLDGPGGLRDALYTEPDRGPWQLVLSILAEDVRNLLNRLLRRRKTAPEPEETGEEAFPGREPAERGAFERFLLEYRRRLGREEPAREEVRSRPGFEIEEETREPAAAVSRTPEPKPGRPPEPARTLWPGREGRPERKTETERRILPERRAWPERKPGPDAEVRSGTKTEAAPRGRTGPWSPYGPEAASGPKTPSEPKAPAEGKLSPERKIPPERKLPEGPKLPPGPKALAERKAPAGGEIPAERKIPPEANKPEGPKLPAGQKVPPGPKVSAEQKDPEGPKLPEAPKTPSEPKEPAGPEPKPEPEPETGRGRELKSGTAVQARTEPEAREEDRPGPKAGPGPETKTGTERGAGPGTLSQEKPETGPRPEARKEPEAGAETASRPEPKPKAAPERRKDPGRTVQDPAGARAKPGGEPVMKKARFVPRGEAYSRPPGKKS